MKDWKNSKAEGEMLLQDAKMSKLALLSKANQIDEESLKKLDFTSIKDFKKSLSSIDLKFGVWYKASSHDKTYVFNMSEEPVIVEI